MSDVRVERQRFDAVFRGAVGRARGMLRQLDLSQLYATRDVLLPVLTANAGSLRELHLRIVLTDKAGLYTTPTSEMVRDIMAAAPLLQVLTAESVSSTCEDALQMLHAEPPFAPLRLVHRLAVHFSDQYGLAGGMERVGPFAAALADAALQPALLRLFLYFADTAQPAVMGALADAALARRLRELSFWHCTPPAAAPLSRLLAEGSLAVFEFHDPIFRTPLFDTAGAALVADALRVNTTLTKLVLRCPNLCFNTRVAGAFLGTLAGHRSLRELRLTTPDRIVDRSTLGAALASLIAADAPALHALECSGNRLGDAGLAPIVEALALNHHLRTLDVSDNDMSEALARERLLPAVCANTTLRALHCFDDVPWAAQEEAEELVRRRGHHS
jgi:hypothetical protein